jgi:hypothetical protein
MSDHTDYSRKAAKPSPLGRSLDNPPQHECLYIDPRWYLVRIAPGGYRLVCAEKPFIYLDKTPQAERATKFKPATEKRNIKNMFESVRDDSEKFVSRLRGLSAASQQNETSQVKERQQKIWELENLVKTIISSCSDAPLEINQSAAPRKYPDFVNMIRKTVR